LRFLWESNAPWAGTGYGSQTKLMLRALKGLGHEPVCFAFYGLSGGQVEYDGYTVLPNSDFDTFGNDVIKAHIERSRSDAVVTLMDLFVLEPNIWGSLDVPWAAWIPIDSVGIGSMTLDRLKHVTVPIAMSEFGFKQMENHDIAPAGVIYHAVDTDIFRPLDKYECREFFSLDPDAFIVGMVMANKGDRKQYPIQMQAVRNWMVDNPDYNIKVYLHTEPTSMMGGWDMAQLSERLGLKGKVYATNQYDTSVDPFGQEKMAMLYNCFDVLMNVSAGEGFGIPIIEAQSCGVPVLTHSVTAMPEITVNGYTVDPISRGLASHYGWQFMPDVDNMVYRLECVYRMTDKSGRIKGRDWVIRNCSLPVIAGQWATLLSTMEESLEDHKLAARTWWE
jgi:glycosyltransferase involved in cell wall biosynthesis